MSTSMTMERTVPVIRDRGDLDAGFFSLFFSNSLFLRDSAQSGYSPCYGKEAVKDEKDIIQAQLCVELIDEYHYPAYLIELGRYIETETGRKEGFLATDIIIKDKKGNVGIIFRIGAFGGYEKDRGKAIRDLFALAGSLRGNEKLKYLIYFSQAIRSGKKMTKISIVDRSKSDTFEDWKKAGRPIRVADYDILSDCLSRLA